MVYIIYFANASPHDTRLARRQEYFNEASLQLATYHLTLFPLAVSFEDENIMGWSLIGFVGSILVVNLTVILISNIQALRRKLFLRKLKKN